MIDPRQIMLGNIVYYTGGETPLFRKILQWGQDACNIEILPSEENLNLLQGVQRVIPVRSDEIAPVWLDDKTIRLFSRTVYNNDLFYFMSDKRVFQAKRLNTRYFSVTYKAVPVGTIGTFHEVQNLVYAITNKGLAISLP